ncbi:MAG: transglutaminase-like domain-containing protein [Lachnospiraceae bacterium]|nr:transglutaminase-like domain-containing protein [Lachnospiraceae bacterium]
MGNIKMNSPANERYRNIENMRLKESRRANKKMRLTLICDAAIAIVIMIGIMTGCRSTDAEFQSEAVQNTQSVTAESAEPAEVEKNAETVEPSEDENATETAEPSEVENSAENNDTASGSTAEPEYTELHEMTADTGSWHDSTKSHDITVNSILNYDDNAIFNFNDTVAVGVCGQNGIISTTETESGFILSVIDNDSVKVRFYNNGTENIVPTQVLAEMSNEDYLDETGATEYIIDGYEDCTDGFGLIQMTLSNGRIVRAGVLRENDRLYAANFTKKPEIAENNVDFRLKMEPILEANNITPDNQTYTDPIYYPIVPVASSERMDVDFWVNQANELVQDDWTDAHKLDVFYEYIIDNYAYDYWVIGNTDSNSRAFYHKDYTGEYYTSNTHVGICEDFANILAIMCRAQNIPATKIYTDEHAWTYVYIADYGRWMSVDVTKNLIYGCYSEDTTDWTTLSNKRFADLDNVSGKKLSSTCGVAIGNQVDMERYGKIPVEKQ